MALRLFILAALGTAALAGADQPAYDLPPIRYSTSKPTDRVSDLGVRLAAGKTALAHDEAHGYLKAFLSEMGVPVSSQALVFSKTSFQARRISPRTPRALYFTDDLYVGWVQGGEVLEISSVDPQLGAVFYSISQEPAKPPALLRQTDNCLQCHDSRGHTLGVPGHIVRSVFPAGDGHPHLNFGTFRTTHRSPFAERWGGWYVTGTHGAMRHMGNVFYPGGNEPDLERLGEKGANRTDLAKFVDLAPYLADSSDIVALMVFEHQAHLHNLITRANHETRVAVFQSEELNRMTGSPPGTLSPAARSRIQHNGDALVEAVLFSGEAPLTDTVRGNTGFSGEFEKRGPFDRRGRSLRQFDLKTRLFKHPCSYLVYSRAFRELPEAARRHVSDRMRRILLDPAPPREFAHLSPADRTAILEILKDTLPDFTRDWN